MTRPPDDRSRLVSVIVPTKESAEFLSACLSSIRKQTYQDIEVIVVDNDSSDATKFIAGQLADRVYDCGPERSSQVNYGVSQSQGEFVYRVDSDFVLDANVIQQCVDKVDQGFDAVVVHNSPDPRASWIARIRHFEVSMYKFNLTHSAARFFRKSTFETLGGYNPEITAGEDYDIQNRLNRAGITVGFIDAEAVHLGEPRRLIPHLKKYYDYGRNFVNFRRANPAEFKAQLTPFRAVYLHHWRSFATHPLRGLGFLLYSFAKFCSAGAGYLRAQTAPHRRRGH